jgi:uncharacterized membrane protein
MKRKTPLKSIFFVLLCTLLTSAGQYFIKLGSVQINNFASIFNFSLIFGLFLYGSAAILLLLALRNGELSVLYPFIALSFVWVFLISTFVLKENILLINWFGLVLIILGVYFTGLGSEKAKVAK